jgi:hypothetical protein
MLVRCSAGLGGDALATGRPHFFHNLPFAEPYACRASLAVPNANPPVVYLRRRYTFTQITGSSAQTVTIIPKYYTNVRKRHSILNAIKVGLGYAWGGWRWKRKGSMSATS